LRLSAGDAMAVYTTAVQIKTSAAAGRILRTLRE
jgi:hypothetical protein